MSPRTALVVAAGLLCAGAASAANPRVDLCQATSNHGFNNDVYFLPGGQQVVRVPIPCRPEGKLTPELLAKMGWCESVTGPKIYGVVEVFDSSNPGWKPLHQMMLRTSSARASSSNG